MNASIFAHADFPDCECCSCDILGNFEKQLKVAQRIHAGYKGYTSPDAGLFPGFDRYRSVVSRGHGKVVGGAGYRVVNAVSCTRRMTADQLTGSFGSPDAGFEFTGSTDSDFYDGETLEDSSVDCADGFFDFNPSTSAVIDDTRQKLTSATQSEFEPMGETTFFNLYTWAQFRRDIFRLLQAVEWGETTVTDTLGASIYALVNDDSGTNYAQRIAVKWRRRFRIPPSHSGVKILWNVYWTPAGGSPELVEAVVWQWDREVPEGYDPEDEDTWPTTPWQELPQPDEDGEAGTYTATDFEARCEADDEAEAPTDGEAVTV